MTSRRARPCGRALAVGSGVLVAAVLVVAGCAGSDDTLMAPPISREGAGKAPATGARTGDAPLTASPSDGSPGEGSRSGGAPSDGMATDAPSSTTTVVTTPTPIEGTLVDPAAAWPATAAASAGPTRITFSDGSDNQVVAPIFQPAAPAVPQATTTTAGGATTARVGGYEFADPAAAAAWVDTWAAYQADEVADLPGGAHVERHPIAAPTGWSGFLVDALYDGGAQWQRTATLVRATGPRAYVASVRWFGDPATGVPDLAAPVGALAHAQDDALRDRGIGTATPGTGTAGRAERLGLAERAAPWAALLGLPDVDPAAGSAVLVADTAATLPAGAVADGATAVAARAACGPSGCPVYSVVTRFASPEAAAAAAARWSQPEAGLGPLDEAAFPAGTAISGVTLVDASATPGASALTATVSDGTTSYQAGAAWLARGDTVYGAFTVYPSAARNAEAAPALLAANIARLDALGLT